MTTKHCTCGRYIGPHAVCACRVGAIMREADTRQGPAIVKAYRGSGRRFVYQARRGVEKQEEMGIWQSE